MNVLTAYMGYSSECSRNIPSLLVDVHVWHYNLSVKLARGKNGRGTTAVITP